MIKIPNNGPKKAPIVSIIDNRPILLIKDTHNEPITNPKTQINKPEDLAEKLFGKKFIMLLLAGIKFAIKFVLIDAINIVIKTRIERFI